MNNEPLDSEYSYREMKEALIKDDIRKLTREITRDEVLDILIRGQDLRSKGIPEDEINRVISNEFGGTQMQTTDYWRPDPKEIGAGIVTPYTDNIPSSKYPPSDDNRVDRQFEPYLSEPYPMTGLELKKVNASVNYDATASKTDSQPSMHNEEGWVGTKVIPEWQYNIEDSQMSELEEGGVGSGRKKTLPHGASTFDVPQAVRTPKAKPAQPQSAIGPMGKAKTSMRTRREQEAEKRLAVYHVVPDFDHDICAFNAIGSSPVFADQSSTVVMPPTLPMSYAKPSSFDTRNSDGIPNPCSIFCGYCIPE